jgi:hypothetical protein
VRGGRISIPVNDTSDRDAYLAVITPERDRDSERPARRYEAEEVEHRGESDPLAPNNRYAVLRSTGRSGRCPAGGW